MKDCLCSELAERRRRAVAASTVLLLGLCIPWAPSTAARQDPQVDYLVYVVCESADKIALVRFGPKGTRVDKLIETGSMPSDIDGPHGIVVSPDKQFFYVSLGHGRPFGSVWKYSADDQRVLGKVTLGYFPATMDISQDGGLLYVVNFNLHGDMVPSSVSVVATEPMIEIARIPTCTCRTARASTRRAHDNTRRA